MKKIPLLSPVKEEPRTLPNETVEEKTLKMQVAYLKGALHMAIKEINEYMEWSINRDKQKESNYIIAWKKNFVKLIGSLIENKIHEVEKGIEQIKYKP